jgi:methylenetetrahydrofolate dehydrogenase (NADP+)/methenyltetrahydrofolate cyclohydrolase/formyltetrahydrofolate synthetase
LLHAYTKNPEQITSEADIVVADVGIPNIVRGNWIKKGAVIIDMGTNQVKVTTITEANFNNFRFSLASK